MSPDNANDQLRDGQVLADRYLVEQVIGRGGMAEVYRGRDNRLTRPVALKVLRSKYGLDPDLRLRFEEEARAAALVSHPNIVAVYDAGEDDSKAFIVMELVNGETLYDLISRGPIDAFAARSIGGQILDALGAAHAKGVLHRDIKPANVLITPEGQAKVADFGIAKAIHPSPDSDQTTMNMVLGTPSYLAPERAQGHPATVGSDIWSVGVLLYEAVTGVKPFEGENPIAITLAAQQGHYIRVLERRPDLDASLAAVIERALEPDPAARYSSAPEMAAALRGPGFDATQVMGAGMLGSTGADATQILGAATTRQEGLGAAALGGAALGGAALGGAAAGAGVGAMAGAGAAGAPTGRSTFSRQEDGYAARGRRSRRGGVAVLVGAALALLVGGILALALTGSNGDNTPGTSSTTAKLVGSTAPKTTTTTSSSTTTTTTQPATTTTAATTTTTSTQPTTTSSSSSTTTPTTPPTSTIPTSQPGPPTTAAAGDTATTTSTTSTTTP